MKIRNRTVTQGQDQQVLEGIQKDLQTMAVIYLGGETFTPATLEARIQARVDAANAILAAKAAWLDTVKKYDALDQQTSLIVHDLKLLVMGAVGRDSPKLADFGFTAPKVPTMTEEQKKVAVAKRLATRKARNTMGPKAKLAVTGATPQPPKS